MGKFWDWIVDGETNDERPQAVIEAAKVSAPKEPEKRGYAAKSKSDIEASKAAQKEWDEREEAAFKAYVPTRPEFKIVQMPAGHFVIQRRYTYRRRDYSGFSSLLYPIYRWADEIEKYPVEPIDAYEAVKNTDAPILTKNYRYGYNRYGSEYSLSGYADLAFNVFEDAEAYLFRMATPQECEVGYDFPPLKKRVATKKKAASK